jgi:hypothetical protein
VGNEEGTGEMNYPSFYTLKDKRRLRAFELHKKYGQRVDVKDLRLDARFKRSVIHRNWGIKPAAWVVNMAFCIVLDAELYYYNPELYRLASLEVK